ncbi:MAG: ABC transporter permease [Chloroflexaceae bacterium]|nr:ABC transporter permease [Chloroflexaceae bacterium]
MAARLPAATAAPSPPTPPKRSSQSMLAQIHIQAWRALGLLRRDRVSLLLLLGQAPLVAGLLLLLVQPDTLLGMHQAGQVQRGAAGQLLFVLVLAGLWFGIISAARSIASERLIYERERRAGLSIIAYLVAKLAVLAGWRCSRRRCCLAPSAWVSPTRPMQGCCCRCHWNCLVRCCWRRWCSL